MPLSPNETYRTLIYLFRQFAEGHEMIGSFSHGELSLADLSRNDAVVYPIMHVVPEGFPYQVEDQGGSYRQMRFRIIFMDRPRDKSDNKADYQKEVISDCDQLQRDLLAIIKNGSLFGGGVDIVDAGEGEPFVQRFENVLAGVENSITLGFGWTLDACDVPGTFQQPPGTIAEVVGSNPLYMLRSVYDPNSIGDPVVFTVNGTAPDSSGNVTVTTGAATVVRTTAGWVTNGTQVLSSGQAGFDSELLLTKIGDGVTTYANLEYTHATNLHDTAANFAVSNPVLAHGQIAIEQDTFKMKVGDEFGTAYNSLPYIVQDANITFSDVTTNNASTSMHGFLKKLDNDSTHFMDGQGNWDTVKDSDLSLSDITTNDVSNTRHGFAPKNNNKDDYYLNGQGLYVHDRDVNLIVAELLGGSLKGMPPMGGIDRITTTAALADNIAKYVPVYLPRAGNITGVTWWQAVQGVYTADQNCKVGLYTYSSGTLTKVAESTNDGNLWKGTANTWQRKAFNAVYAAEPGLYFIGLLYNTSAQTTAPTLGAAVVVANLAIQAMDFANSAKLYTQIAAQNDLPATQVMSGLSGITNQTWVGLY